MSKIVPTLWLLLQMALLHAQSLPARWETTGGMNAVKMPAFAAPQQGMASKPGGPLRFAHPFVVNFTPSNSGEWHCLADGTQIWTLLIYSEGAYSLNLIFDRFNLPEHSRLFVYAPHKDEVYGFFTHNDNPASGVMPTIPVPGEYLVVEYQQDPRVCELVDLCIGAVNHDYLNAFGSAHNLKVGSFGDSGSCNLNASCLPNQLAEPIDQSVVRLMVDGIELCTGTLLNTTHQGGEPYVLSAAHCFRRGADAAPTTIFLFNYQVPACQPQMEGPNRQFVLGGQMRAMVDTVDFALIEMNSRPPEIFRAYWAGWSLTDAPSAPGVAIHHPLGDVKKIAWYNEALLPVTFLSLTVDGKPFAPDKHWLVGRWTSGTTEGGSSGSGFFDAWHRLVGILSGGEATCLNPVNDFYVQFRKAFRNGLEPHQQLAYWLDPNQTNASSIPGTYYYPDTLLRKGHVESTSITGLERLGEQRGFVAGHNAWRTDGVAEYFDEYRQALVHGVYLMPGSVQAFNGQSLRIGIWSDALGQPGNLLTQTEPIGLDKIPANQESYWPLSVPLKVEGSFYAGVALEYPASKVDSVGMYLVSGDAGLVPDRARFRQAGIWKNYRQVTGKPSAATVWIDLLLSNVEVKDDQKTYRDNIYLYPQQVVQGFAVVSKVQPIRSVELFGANGVRVGYQQVNSPETYMTCSGLASGIYLVKITLENRSVVERKIVKLN